jgi:hypothetical protein
MEAGQDALLIEKPITDRVFLEVVDADDLALPINRQWQREGGEPSAWNEVKTPAS